MGSEQLFIVIAIITAIVFFFAYESRDLNSALDEQRMIMEKNSSLFKEDIEKIQNDLKNGKISPDEAHQEMLNRYEEVNNQNLDVLQKTLEEIVPGYETAVTKQQRTTETMIEQ